MTGLLWLLVSIIGFGGNELFGPIGKVLTNFSIFLTGSLWIIPLILSFIFGAYQVIKNKKPNIFSTRLCGLYLIIIGSLIFCHLYYVTNNDASITGTLTDTIDQLIKIFNNTAAANGGGIIGAVFSLIFVKLFSVNGACVVSAFIILFGININ